ncbi:MAG: DNA/RNA nuclease SfsA [Candidatus Sericytochromatia bacterium]
MDFSPPLLPGRLVQRYKRFLADVRLPDGSMVTAHCPNPGRMTGCAEPGWEVALSYHPGPRRKLPYTLEMIHNGETWIGVNTQRANEIVAEALAAGAIPELCPYTELRREVRYGERSRVDFWLNGPDGACFVEVKSVTLRAGEDCRFPDAVTQRGSRHLDELLAVKQQGHRAVMLFVLQRDDGLWFAPAEDIDPVYARRLRAVAAQGVEVFAYRASLNPQAWFLTHPVPLALAR